MKISNYRKEKFGYVGCDNAGSVFLFKESAKKPLESNKDINIEEHKLLNLDISSDFHLSSPILVMLEITRKCNVQCKHCYIKGGPPRENELTTDELFKLLKKLSEMKVFHLIITGGEPMMRDDFIEIVNYATDLGFWVSVYTNATKFEEPLLKKINNKRNLEFVIGIDGFKNLKTRDVSPEDIKNNINLVRNLGLKISLDYTFTKHNINDVFEVIDWANTNNYNILFTDLVPLGNARYNQELLPKKNDVKKVLEAHKKYELFKLEQWKESNQGVQDTSNPFYLMYVIEGTTKQCKGSRCLAYISSNGDVYPCSNAAAENMYFADNVREKDFSEIWENCFSEMRKIKWDDFKRCDNCDFNKKLKDYQFCKLRCPVLSNIIHGDKFICGGTPYLIKLTEELIKHKETIIQEVMPE
jgi:radical SAM protein with 4Fe4S-binding SPASM domain